jgi:ADP-L-glycero-D-manno-heptose 6-epimerase
MIIITGAAGFIGSCLLRKLNDEHITDILLVDDFSNPAKTANLHEKAFTAAVDRQEFLHRLPQHLRRAHFVFHLGARTDTTEQNAAVFDQLNLRYSQSLWQACTEAGVPLVYASSAATYGDGRLGYEDSHELVSQLQPLNPYGVSKNDFDRWALQQADINAEKAPPRWAGLKFFNVYGPNEYHKARMASVIFHTFHQIRKTGSMRLFRSHRPDIADGEQKRDFIYIRDVVEVCWFLLQNKAPNGLYNVGTGQARTFLDLATATFHALGLKPDISFIDTPQDIRQSYQYYTCANVGKLRQAGFTRNFCSLESAIEEYVRHYLLPEAHW